MKKIFAFTLAETLIVIGIIGVVAALTLPNLNHATGDKEKVTKVKKIYSALTDAFDRAQVIYGDFDTWFNDLSTSEERNGRVGERISEFMKISKDCGMDKEGCFSTAPLLNVGGNVIDDNYYEAHKSSSAYMVTLADGISIAYQGNSIFIDIDGPNKGKNQMANDIFEFKMYDPCSVNGAGIYPDKACEYWYDNIKPAGTYEGNHTAWIIEHGNLDYLKCPDELDWETQTSCK